MIRHDLYRNVHKGLRRELAELLAEAGTVDTTDRRQVKRLADRWRFAASLLDAHHRHEDDHIAPILQKLVPEIALALEYEHVSLFDESSKLLALADAMTDDEEVAQKFYLALSTFVARYFLHMDKEERVAMKAMQRSFRDDELASIEAGIVASVPFELRAAFFSRMLRAMTVSEIDTMLRATKERAPHDLAMLWTLAKASLSSEAFTTLSARFAEPRPDIRAILEARQQQNAA